jgi:class 3 adenylate cyclase
MTKADRAMSKIESDTGQRFSIWEKVVPQDEVQQVINIARSSSPSMLEAGSLAQMEWDAESFLAKVSVPTLILSTRNSGINTLPDSRHLAAGIAGSQFRVLDSNGIAPYYSDRPTTLEAIDALLKPEPPTNQPIPAGFRTVVFTDIVGSTEYVRRVGDEAGRAAVRELEQKVAALAADHEGRVVKNLGDGSLVSFGSNSSAIAFGLEVQDKCSDGPLQLRVGMAAGEPIQEDGDIHGTVVAQASRIGDLGEAGEVIVSDSVRQLAVGKGFDFAPRGEVSLKGFDEPERVWKVTQTDRK